MSELEDLRRKITKTDEYIIRLLAERMKTAEKVRDYKKAHNMPGLSADRWAKLQKLHAIQCKEAGLDPKLAGVVFEDIHEYVLENIHKDLKQ